MSLRKTLKCDKTKRSSMRLNGYDEEKEKEMRLCRDGQWNPCCCKFGIAAHLQAADAHERFHLMGRWMIPVWTFLLQFYVFEFEFVEVFAVFEDF